MNKDTRDGLRRTQRRLRDEFQSRARQHPGLDAARRWPAAPQAGVRACRPASQAGTGRPQLGRGDQAARAGSAHGHALAGRTAGGRLMADDLTAPRSATLADEARRGHRPGGAAAGRWPSRRTGSTGRSGWPSPGKVKAGKSTLLNALLGEELAPTDAGECTRIVTWYRYSDRPYATHLPGRRRPASRRPYARGDGALEVDLGGRDAEAIDHLEVGWPTSRLRDVDPDRHPGHRVDLHRRVGPDPPGAVGRGRAGCRSPTPCSTCCGTRTAPTCGSSSPSTTTSWPRARRSTRSACCPAPTRSAAAGWTRWRSPTGWPGATRPTPRLRRLCPVVVPVAGLLGHAAATLREDEYAALAAVAAGAAATRSASCC